MSSMSYLEIRDTFQNTPLHLATICNNTHCVRILLQKQANYQSLNCEALSPRDIALTLEMEELYNAFV